MLEAGEWRRSNEKYDARRKILRRLPEPVSRFPLQVKGTPAPCQDRSARVRHASDEPLVQTVQTISLLVRPPCPWYSDPHRGAFWDAPDAPITGPDAAGVPSAHADHLPGGGGANCTVYSCTCLCV